MRYRTAGPSNSRKTDILLAPLESLAAGRPLFMSVAAIVNPRVSPDGRLLAYASNESGRAEVYLTPIPGPGPKVPVSVNGGTEPAWAPDGSTLYYRVGPPGNGRMMAATIAERPELTVTKRDTLFADVYMRTEGHSAYDVFPDGRLAMLRPAQANQKSAPVFAIVNWQQMLETMGPRAIR
jgi:hypothetical protein